MLFANADVRFLPTRLLYPSDRSSIAESFRDFLTFSMLEIVSFPNCMLYRYYLK